MPKKIFLHMSRLSYLFEYFEFFWSFLMFDKNLLNYFPNLLSFWIFCAFFCNMCISKIWNSQKHLFNIFKFTKLVQPCPKPCLEKNIRIQNLILYKFFWPGVGRSNLKDHFSIFWSICHIWPWSQDQKSQ